MSEIQQLVGASLVSLTQYRMEVGGECRGGCWLGFG